MELAKEWRFGVVKDTYVLHTCSTGTVGVYNSTGSTRSFITPPVQVTGACV